MAKPKRPITSAETRLILQNQFVIMQALANMPGVSITQAPGEIGSLLGQMKAVLTALDTGLRPLSGAPSPATLARKERRKAARAARRPVVPTTSPLDLHHDTD